MRRLRFALAMALLGPLLAPSHGSAAPVRLNHLQMVGTHNSYHVEASPAESMIRREAGYDDSSLAFSHLPVGEQLATQNVRQLEFDVFADPRGGRFAAPRLRRLAGEPAYDPVMRRPGTKVLHIQDYDYRSLCLTLVRCLRSVRDWSRAHPRHVPLAIMLDLKDAPLPPGLPATVPLPWTGARMDRLDEEIRSVFRRRELLVPDDVRGRRGSLRTAIRRDGWPTVSRSRGKVMFLMANRDRYRSRYVAGHPGLAGRILFTNSSPASPDAAFIEVSDPRGARGGRIRRLVRRGFVVRTRADTDTIEARANDARRAASALASGAQWVSTDYPAPGTAARFGSSYFVALPGDVPARCNPVTASPTCRTPRDG